MITQKPFPDLPGPRPDFLWGWRGNVRRFGANPIQYLEHCATYGDVVAFAKGGNGAIFSQNPQCPGTVFLLGAKHNERVLTNPDLFQVPSLRSEPTAVLQNLGRSLFSLNGEAHLQTRRLLLPAFSQKAIANYYDAIVASVMRLLEDWQMGQTIPILAAMRQVGLYLANQTIFGETDFENEASNGRLCQQLLQLRREDAGQVQLDWAGSPYQQYTQLGEKLDRALRQQIRTLRAQPETNPPSILSLLCHAQLEDGTTFAEDELVGQANTLFLAGHDTTASALVWIFFLLAQNPEHYARLYTELQTLPTAVAPTFAQIESLSFLEAVIQEGLRLLPPSVMLPRVLAAETAVGTWRLPAGTEIMISPYWTHRQPQLYPSPNQFLPERWYSIQPSPYEYLPFSGGSRRCIGGRLALLEMKMVLAMILSRYQLTFTQKERIDWYIQVTLLPKQDIPLKLQQPNSVFTKLTVNGSINQLVVF